MAMAVTKGVLKSVRMANLRLRMKALDGPRCCGVYRLGRNAWPRQERLQARGSRRGSLQTDQSVWPVLRQRVSFVPHDITADCGEIR
jgi:hypothetical protein